MKKIILGVIAAGFALGAHAGPAADVASVTAGTTYELCDGTAGGGKVKVWGGSGTVLTSAQTPVFTRNGFDVQCSSNVFLKVQEVDSNTAVVGSGSAKGNQSFRGHTNGGAIGASAKCTGGNDACTSGDVDTAITAAIADASS